jgi:glycosyltransferase involved in cell wall biosynthesis
MTELGIYTRYSELGASSRLRCYRYSGMLRECGFDVRMHPLFGDDTLHALYACRGRSGKLARDLARRMFRLPCAEKNLWIEYELLPGVPCGVERLYLRNRRYVLSFDDAVYLKYRGKRLLDGKFERLAAGAVGVMAANDLLVEHFARFNANTVKIPTAVDTDALAPGAEKFPRFTVAWIGTPVTFAAHFSPFVPLFRELKSELDVDFAVIGGGEAAAREFPEARHFAWSEAVEREVLPRCHVGIMPLPAGDDFAAGKSAYKLLQYLAAGLPAVASPVGENRVVLESGATGFFAAAPGEWREALRRLVADGKMRDEMAAAARAVAVDRYSVRRYAPIIENFLKKTFFGA